MNRNEKMRITYQRGMAELREQTIRAHKLTKVFNDLDVTQDEEKEKILVELFGTTGIKPYIEYNFHCDLGKNIHVGNHFYAGFNFTVLDMAEVRIGDNCMIGPNVGLYTAGHSLEPKGRNKGGYAIPITVGNDVWIGGSCTILAGVSIGDNSVVAAGSVVVKDVPPNVVVAGNPARVIKEL